MHFLARKSTECRVQQSTHSCICTPHNQLRIRSGKSERYCHNEHPLFLYSNPAPQVQSTTVNVQPLRVINQQTITTMRMKMQPSDPSRGRGKRILCYGDSLTAGLIGNWCTRFEPYAKRLSQLLDARVDHVGLCGWDTKQMVDAMDSSCSTDVKVYLFGIFLVVFVFVSCMKAD